VTSCRAASQTDVGRYPAQSHQPGGQQRASPVPTQEGVQRGVAGAVSSANCRAVSTAPITVMPSSPDTCGPSLNLRLKTSSTVQTGIDGLVGDVTVVSFAW
jgi:hypothetical protein